MIEGLDLHAVTPGRYYLVCLPLKFPDLDGAPVFMASSDFTLTYEIERAPKITFSDIKDYQRHDAVAA